MGPLQRLVTAFAASCRFYAFLFFVIYLFFLMPLCLIGLPLLARRHTLPRIFNCSERSERIYPTNCLYLLLTLLNAILLTILNAILTDWAAVACQTAYLAKKTT